MFFGFEEVEDDVALLATPELFEEELTVLVALDVVDDDEFRRTFPVLGRRRVAADTVPADATARIRVVIPTRERRIGKSEK